MARHVDWLSREGIRHDDVERLLRLFRGWKIVGIDRLRKLAEDEVKIEITPPLHQMPKSHIARILRKSGIHPKTSPSLVCQIAQPLHGTGRDPHRAGEIQPFLHEGVQDAGCEEPAHRAAFHDEQTLQGSLHFTFFVPRFHHERIGHLPRNQVRWVLRVPRSRQRLRRKYSIGALRRPL